MVKQRLTFEETKLYGVFCDEIGDHPTWSFRKIYDKVFKKNFKSFKPSVRLKAELKKAYERDTK
jgi:hypothetical protein